jgi:hypothetical protein
VHDVTIGRGGGEMGRCVHDVLPGVGAIGGASDRAARGTGYVVSRHGGVNRARRRA